MPISICHHHAGRTKVLPNESAVLHRQQNHRRAQHVAMLGISAHGMKVSAIREFEESVRDGGGRAALPGNREFNGRAGDPMDRSENHGG